MEVINNTLGDLNNFLFAQLERLDNEELSPEELQQEFERAKAISSVANQIISNANVVLKAQQFYDDRNDIDAQKPKMLEG